MNILLVTERFSIGVLDLAAFYEQYGHRVGCVLTQDLNKVRGKYDVVGLSCFGFDAQGEQLTAASIIAQLKDLSKRFPSADLWLGGRAMSLMPHSILYKIQDAVPGIRIAVGDGEHAMAMDDPAGVDIDYKKYPAWTERHVLQLVGSDRRPDVVAVQSARGCPYSCGFCHQSQKLKFFSPERTATNVQLVAKNIKFPMMIDDIFTLSGTRMAKIRRAMDARNIRYQKQIRFFTHVSHGNEDEIAKFDPDEVQIGIESGDDRMLVAMDKGTTRAESKAAVLRLGKAIPKRVVGLFLIGYPGETVASLEATLSFVKETKQHYKHIWVSYFIPVPGTPGMQEARKAGKLLDRPVSNREVTYVADSLTEGVLRKYCKLITEASR